MASMSTPDQPIDSYASPARRRGYVRAMRQIAAGRQLGRPVRVYVSAPPVFLDRPNWERRLAAIRAALPPGVELSYFRTVFDPAVDYHEQWANLAHSFDGLVVTGTRRERKRIREHTLGHIARQELIAQVGAGKPVLLHSMEYGLVPVLDCRPKRVGNEPRARLRLTIPRDWSNNAPTLQAALHALQPGPTEAPQEKVGAPPHLAHPFAASAC